MISIRFVSAAFLTLSAIALQGQALPQPEFNFRYLEIIKLPDLSLESKLRHISPSEGEIHIDVIVSPEGAVSKCDWVSCPDSLKVEAELFFKAVTFKPAVLNAFPQWSKGHFLLKAGPEPGGILYSFWATSNPPSSPTWLAFPHQ